MLSSSARTCAVCCDRLDSRASCLVLNCGHVFHADCIHDWEEAQAERCRDLTCPTCRVTVDEERVERASAYPAAAATAGGYREYVPRSGVARPGAPTRASSQPAAAVQAALRGEPGQAELLRRVEAQLAAQRAVSSGRSGASSWLFLLDVSASMGSTRAWSPAGASRVCFGLAALAAMVSSQVAAGDRYKVVAFDGGVEDLVGWTRRDRGGSGDLPLPLLQDFTARVRGSGLRRSGTATCQAVHRAMGALAAKAREAPSVHAHNLVLLTDGEAMDVHTEYLDMARWELCEPRFDGGGFRALLLHIDSEGGASDSLTRLARRPGGGTLEWVKTVRLRLGSSLNLDDRRDQETVGAFSAAVSGISTMAASPAPRRR